MAAKIKAKTLTATANFVYNVHPLDRSEKNKNSHTT